MAKKSTNQKKLQRLKFFSVYIIPAILIGKISIMFPIIIIKKIFLKVINNDFFQDSASSTFQLDFIKLSSRLDI